MIVQRTILPVAKHLLQGWFGSIEGEAGASYGSDIFYSVLINCL